MSGDATVGVRALLHELFDYAGLFPPAKLELPPAISNFARYSGDPESWMLGRFVIPARLLPSLNHVVAEPLREAGGAYRFAAIVGGGEDRTGSLLRLANDLEAVGAFEDAHDGLVRVEAFETSLPTERAKGESADAVGEHISRIRSAISESGLGDRALYVEVPGTPSWRTVDSLVFDAVGEIVEQAPTLEDTEGPLGVKLRCGGATPAAYPSANKVLYYLQQARRRGVPLKFTAGLHHPVMNLDAESCGNAFGFLNVLGAGLLTGRAGLESDTLMACLTEPDAGAFSVDDLGFHWRGHSVPPDEILSARRDLFIGIGTCSFDEPRDDLRELALLES